MTSNRLSGGTFNLKYGRDHAKVKHEIEGLLEKHDLDFLCLQEANDYYSVLNKIDGYDYIAGPDTTGRESTILVKSTLKQDKIKFKKYGDGWTTLRGGKHSPTGQTQVRIDGWLFVRSLHIPTPSGWKNGKIDDSVTPPERKDDLIASMKGLKRYLGKSTKRNARLAAGDWNEPPTTSGQYSPTWLRKTTKSSYHLPTSTAGHGHIDWMISKGIRVLSIIKDTHFKQGSDHKPVIFTVRKISN